MGTQVSKSALLDRFFQYGYVTRNLDAATAKFGERFGPAQWSTLSGSPEVPQVKRVGFTFRDGINVEIIEVNAQVPSLYKDFLPDTEEDIRLHHHGHLIDDYDGVLNLIKSEGYDMPFAIDDPAYVQFCYADTRTQLGHYLEFICLGDGGRQLFESVPGFSGFR